MNRRDWMTSMSLVAVAGFEGAAIAASDSALPAGARVPQCRLAYECDVTLSQALEFGPTLEGQRRVIPITGGSFAGPRIRGQVISGGADWNLSRSDGAGSVDAAYYLRTDDGVLIRIVNKGVGAAGQAPRDEAAEHFFMFTMPVFEAPTGKYDWLNRGVFVGTLGARAHAVNAVLIRVFELV